MVLCCLCKVISCSHTACKKLWPLIIFILTVFCKSMQAAVNYEQVVHILVVLLGNRLVVLYKQKCLWGIKILWFWRNFASIYIAQFFHHVLYFFEQMPWLLAARFCVATIREQHLFHWKAHRHQQLLGKVRKSKS